jgi:hypothetical protein
MYLGSYRFEGDPAALFAAYERLCAGFPPGAIELQLCIADDDGITVFDACPSRDTFVAFSGGPDFAAALWGVGLPTPVVTPLGTVRAVRVKDGVA